MDREEIRNQTYTPPTEFTFNFPRLVKEIDGLVDNRKEKVFEEVQQIRLIAENAIMAEKEKQLKQFEKEYQAQATLAYETCKEDLLRELRSARTVINIPERASINVSHDDHPQFQEVLTTLLTFHKVMLVGKAGTGKTYMSEQFAERLELPFYKYSCSRDSSVHDLLGYKQPRSEEYLETAFLNAYENGGIFLVDEFDAASGDMSLFFNGVSDNSKTISVPHRDQKPVATKHKDFYIIFSGNTWGSGSIEYSGRDFQDLALMDRFRFARHEVFYHSIFEESVCKSISQSLYGKIIQCRAALEQSGSYLSTRNVEDVVQYVASKIALIGREVNGNVSADIYTKFLFEGMNRMLYNLDPLEQKEILDKIFGNNHEDTIETKYRQAIESAPQHNASNLSADVLTGTVISSETMNQLWV